MQYELVLKNEKIKNYRLIARLVILLGCLFTIALVVYTNLLKVRIAGITALSLIVCWTIYYYVNKKKQNAAFEATALFLLAVYFLFPGIYWLAIVFFIIAGLYIEITKLIVIIFNEDGIKIASFPAKNYDWQQLNNIILRDNLLTLDFVNNKLLQQPIINTQWDINPKEFNEFCQKMLEKVKQDNN